MENRKFKRANGSIFGAGAHVKRLAGAIRAPGFPRWNHIRIPALVVKGELSPRISPGIFAEIKMRCPQAELAEVSNSDHHVMLDDPGGFVRAVKSFLARHP